MTEREAPLRAVCESPDDDTPRLVFADWLQEHGDEARAEFIRAQIKLHAHKKYTVPWAKCNSHARKLLATHELRWRAELPSAPGWMYGEFSRGFVQGLYVADFEVFASHAERIVRAVPLRTAFFRADANVDLSRLALVPHVRFLSAVWVAAVRCRIDDARCLVEHLADAQMKEFGFLNCWVEDAARELLLNSLVHKVRFAIS